MSRWRPPVQASSHYITAEGHVRLKAEYEELWTRRRPEVVRALAAAAAEGDRSENAEYQYRKKELREIDRRVGYLQRRIPQLQVVDRPPGDPARVYFGATVCLADEQGDERSYRIVGPDETDAAQGRISIDAPLARALLGKTEGDRLRVALPQGEALYELVEIRYGRP